LSSTYLNSHPLAVNRDAVNVQAKHQPSHHFVAESAWWDEAVLTEAHSMVEPVP
jgi:SRSO17 transposase